MAISPAAAHHRAVIAGIKRAIRNGERPADDPVLAQAERDLRDVLLIERAEKLITECRNDQHPPPWLARLSEESRAAIAAGVADWPELKDHQRERLRLLLRPRGGDRRP